jgi:hypothetical protein
LVTDAEVWELNPRPERESKFMPTANAEQRVTEESSANLGKAYLVKWAQADEVVNTICNRILLDYEVRCTAANNYRSWLLWQVVQKLMVPFRAECRRKLVRLLYQQIKEPKGKQEVHTREWKPGFTDDVGVQHGFKHGVHAKKNPVGRPKLTPSQRAANHQRAVRAYNARKAKGKWKWKHHAEAIRPRAAHPRPHPGRPNKSGPTKAGGEFVAKIVEDFAKAMADEVVEFISGKAEAPSDDVKGAAEGGSYGENYNRF